MTKQTKNQHNNALTTIIICGNFENTIGDCIKSIKWANEIIIVFANSTDNSKKLPKNLFLKPKQLLLPINTASTTPNGETWD